MLGATLDALEDVEPLPGRVTVHLDAGYDDEPCRAEPTDRWLARCTERTATAVQAYLDLAAAIVTVRALLRAAWTHYRWSTRPRTPRIR